MFSIINIITRKLYEVYYILYTIHRNHVIYVIMILNLCIIILIPHFTYIINTFFNN